MCVSVELAAEAHYHRNIRPPSWRECEKPTRQIISTVGRCGYLYDLHRLIPFMCLVIKHPMDLGTILKKVKAQQYKDKKAFKADLDLIWDNCLLYNTLPVSYIHPVQLHFPPEPEPFRACRHIRFVDPPIYFEIAQTISSNSSQTRLRRRTCLHCIEQVALYA